MSDGGGCSLPGQSCPPCRANLSSVQAKDSTLRRLAYGGSLGRLTQGHRGGLTTGSHYHASLNSNLALRTAV